MLCETIAHTSRLFQGSIHLDKIVYRPFITNIRTKVTGEPLLNVAYLEVLAFPL